MKKKKRSTKSDFLCMLCFLKEEDQEREESSRVLESIQEETFKFKRCFPSSFLSFFFIFSSFPFLCELRSPQKSKLRFLGQKKVELEFGLFFFLYSFFLFFCSSSVVEIRTIAWIPIAKKANLTTMCGQIQVQPFLH